MAADDAVKTNWDVTLSPNPAKNNALVSISGKTNNASVTVTDVTGRVIWQKQNVQTAQIKLPLANIKPGVYMVTVKNGEGSKTIKLVKE